MAVGSGIGVQYAASINRRDGTSPFLSTGQPRPYDPAYPQNMPGSFTGETFEFMPGTYMFLIFGNFDGATVELEVSPDKVNWLPIYSGTESAAVPSNKLEKVFARWVVKGGTVNTNITAGFTGGHSG